MDEIERRLGRDPLGVGESRSGDDRLIFSGPLAGYYRVDRSGRAVHILSIGASGRS
jgi:hypothetical protein